MSRWSLVLMLSLLAALPLAAGAGWQAVVGGDGRVRLSRGAATGCTLSIGLFNAKWQQAGATADAKATGAAPVHALRLNVPGGGVVRGVATITAAAPAAGAAPAAPAGLRAEYVFTPEQDVALNSLHVSADFSIATLAGGTWTADEKTGTFPKDHGDTHLFNASIRALKLALPGGGDLAFTFAEPTPVLLQDNRQWGPSFSVRIYRASNEQQPFKQGAPVKLGFTLAAPGGIAVEHDQPVTIVAGADWIPLNLALDIAPGSALDFTQLGLLDAPAGKHGWLRAHPDGSFRSERQPDRPARFYGVNLCFSAHYLDHALADLLAERLARLGYNAVRVHHYEGELTKPDAARLTFEPEKLDQLDYLLAALMKRGLYVTTDLYVSRPVDVAAFAPGAAAAQRDRMNAFKALVPINDAAFANWCAFSRALLEHVNPYTTRAYKDEPGLAWLSLINEGNLGNYVGLIKGLPDYQRAWHEWLLAQYRDRAGLAAAWGAVLRAEEDPAAGTVLLDGNLYSQDARGRDLARFLSQVDADFIRRATKFLRDEVGVRALLTNLNAWTNPATLQGARAPLDYVDDHFYVDHPQFLEQPWRLPSRCPNTSPVAGGASGGRHVAFTRLFDKPYALSEYNYSAPGRYRGVGGILTGALGALQGWGVIWRFAYSHTRANLAQPGALGYFDMAGDPLGQAAERASLCLFARGDLKTAPGRVTIAMTPADLAQPPASVPMLAPAWHWAAWVTRVGTRVGPTPAANAPAPAPNDVTLPLGWATPAERGDPYKLNAAAVLALLRERGIVAAGNPTDPERQVFQSETGEITIDGPRDTLTLDTPRTAGGFAPAGGTIATRHGVSVAVQGVEATVWVSALDDQPITTSKRLLLTHLTDLQNTEIRYAEQARQTLLAWGKLPHLVRAGQAEARVALAEPAAYRVWALSTSGVRLAVVPTTVAAGALVIPANVAAFPAHGAILCYEIARE